MKNTEPLIQHSVDLKDKHTMACPSSALHFAEINDLEQLKQACVFAKQTQLSLKVVGEGSNILFAKQVNSLLVQLRQKTIEVIEENSNELLVQVGAGQNWHQFVLYCQKQGWYGLENLVAIPGTVGAAPVQNIGAYGVELAEVLHQVSYFDPDTLQVVHIINKDCLFAYRDSIFKSGQLQQAIIIAVTFKLKKQFIFK